MHLCTGAISDMSRNEVLFESDFQDGALDLQETWKLEGDGEAGIEDERLALQEEPEGRGVVLWLRRDMPAEVRVEFELAFSNNRGIGVFFLAAKGTEGEDILRELPERTGAYPEYTSGRINCYGVSLHRFFPSGEHNEGSNIRRNAGFHLVHHAEPDPVMESERPYRLVIEKRDARLRLWVDGELVHDWTDVREHGQPHAEGKVGFRLRGHHSCVMYLDHVRIIRPVDPNRGQLFHPGQPLPSSYIGK
jgi:hypothetical protein